MKFWRILLPLISAFLFHACEFNSLDDASNELEMDYAAAELLINEIILEETIKQQNQNARKDSWEKSDKSITIIKYKKGKKGKPGQLLYNTNKDKVKGYQEVTEETITAIVKPGQFVYWYNGGGLEHLDDIEFDDESEDALEDLPRGMKKDKVWLLKIPNQIDKETLKYDILYQIKGEDTVIRLDPKLKIDNE